VALAAKGRTHAEAAAAAVTAGDLPDMATALDLLMHTDWFTHPCSHGMLLFAGWPRSRCTDCVEVGAKCTKSPQESPHHYARFVHPCQAESRGASCPLQKDGQHIQFFNHRCPRTSEFARYKEREREIWRDG
jgi:hypothetical protein